MTQSGHSTVQPTVGMPANACIDLENSALHNLYSDRRIMRCNDVHILGGRAIMVRIPRKVRIPIKSRIPLEAWIVVAVFTIASAISSIFGAPDVSDGLNLAKTP